MATKFRRASFGCASVAGALAAGLVTGSSPRSAAAIELSVHDGEVSGSFDTTITVGAALRVQDRDPDLIGVVNGGMRTLSTSTTAI
jgi:hypothetical protein